MVDTKKTKRLHIGMAYTYVGDTGIDIPCEDATEQKERYDGNNVAKLYGMEYFDLVSDIQSLL